MRATFLPTFARDGAQGRSCACCGRQKNTPKFEDYPVTRFQYVDGVGGLDVCARCIWEVSKELGFDTPDPDICAAAAERDDAVANYIAIEAEYTELKDKLYGALSDHSPAHMGSDDAPASDSFAELNPEE